MVTGLPPTFRRLVAQDVLNIGGRTFEVLSGDGHAPEQLMLHCPAEKLFFAADQVLAKITPNISVWAVEPEGNPLDLYLRSLRSLQASLPSDTLVLPGHQLPFRQPQVRCAELIRHHEERCAAIAAACRGIPRTTAEIVPFVFRRPLDPHQMSFAFSEIQAHVNYMVERGELVWGTGRDIVHTVNLRLHLVQPPASEYVPFSDLDSDSLLGVAALLAISPSVGAADYPSRPITLVVAFTPGGPSDVLARIVGKKMEQLLNVPFVIENRPGAGGNLAAETVAHAAPDGYTLLMGNNSILATNESLYKRLNFSPEKDFTPITLVGTQANILVVNPEVPARSLKELIALAQAQPGKINFASSGYGAAAHLAGELFKSEAKIDIVHVPYKGAAPALQDVIAGHDQMMFATAASVIGHIEGGRVRALAVTTLKRTRILPDLPTMDEAGLKGFDASTWHGLVAPAGTPPQVIAVLHDAAVKALNDASVQASLGKLGVDIVGDTPEEFRAYINSEIPKWTAIVKASGATLDK